MQEYYKVLGVSENATNEEIETAYKTLKEKYSKERFYEGDVGNHAARNLTKLESAYHEIMVERRTRSEKTHEKFIDFSAVELDIKNGNIAGAQQKLDDITDRNAEWHYLQSVVFYKKSWTNESKKQLEIALNMDPHNQKYADSYTKLNQKMAYNDRQFHSGNAGYTSNQEPQNNQQMGGSDAGNCLSFCATWCCMDMLCSMCCR